MINTTSLSRSRSCERSLRQKAGTLLATTLESCSDQRVPRDNSGWNALGLCWPVKEVGIMKSKLFGIFVALAGAYFCCLAEEARAGGEDPFGLEATESACLQDGDVGDSESDLVLNIWESVLSGEKLSSILSTPTGVSLEDSGESCNDGFKNCKLSMGMRICCPSMYECPGENDENPACNNKCGDTFPGRGLTVRCKNPDRKIDLCCPTGSWCVFGSNVGGVDAKVQPCAKWPPDGFTLFPGDRCTLPDYPILCGRFTGSQTVTCCPQGTTCSGDNSCSKAGIRVIPGTDKECPLGKNAFWSGKSKLWYCCEDGTYFSDDVGTCIPFGSEICADGPKRQYCAPGSQCVPREEGRTVCCKAGTIWNPDAGACLPKDAELCSTHPVRWCKSGERCVFERESRGNLELPVTKVGCCAETRLCGKRCCAVGMYCTDKDKGICEWPVNS